MLQEGEKEYAKEITDVLEAKKYHIKAQELQFSLDKDKSEQTTKSFSGLETESSQNPSPQSPQKRKGKRRKAKQNSNENKEKKLKGLEKNERLIGTIRSDEIDQFKTMDISQYDKQEMLDLALKHHSLYVASYLIEYKGCTLKDPSLHIANYLTKDKKLTFLHVAAREGHVGVVKLFLNYGADVNVKTDEGYTPLHLAEKNGHKNVAELLLQPKHKAEVNAVAERSFTSLHFAVDAGCNDIVKLLLDHGAEVNAADEVGFTPLHMAAEKGSKDVVKLLLDHEADINAKDSEGDTPLALALKRDHSEIVNLLLADQNINIGCVQAHFAEKREDRKKFLQKFQQDYKLFNLVKQTVNEEYGGKLDKLLEEIKDLLKPEGKYGLSQV